MRAARSVRSHILPAFVARLRAGGADDLLREHGLKEGVSPADVEMPLPSFRALCDAASSRFGDPFLGFHLAAALPRGEYGLLEFVFRSAATCRDAVNQLVRYAPLVNNLLVITFEETAERCVVVEKILGEPLCLGKHANEFAMANVVRIGRDLAGNTWPVERVWFAHPEPSRPREELARFFGTSRIEWDAGYNAVQVSASVLDMPVRTADSALYGFLEREAAERAGRLSSADAFADVSQAIRRDLAHGEPKVERVAEALRTSARSLQRRLEAGDTSFRALADEVRRAVAQLYLEDHQRPVTEVAFILGYSDARAFVRAYKRWTGRTPGEARRA